MLPRLTAGLVCAVLLRGAIEAAEPPFAAAPSDATRSATWPGVPGVVIDHSPAASGLYIGSPGLAVWTNGDYLASHDFFGPKSEEHECPTVVVFRSADRGQTWQPAARLRCLLWPSLFTHNGAVYLLGTDKHHGRLVIRRSVDGASTWSEPGDATTGLLTPSGSYHTAPVPVIVHRGRLWRAFEDASGGTAWGARYMAGVMSAPADADLLNAANWTFSGVLPRDPQWLRGQFNGWLEGNVVVSRDGGVVNILRVDTPSGPEKAAVVRVSADGKSLNLDPATGFVDFPGGAKKFTIRYDPPSDRYWSLTTVASERLAQAVRPATIRNTLALVYSPDLRNWTVRCILLYHPDVKRHGFQYVDWQFDGEDMIAVCRTAYEDGQGGAHNNHDANFLTFHRIGQFRTKTGTDPVALWPTADQPTQPTVNP